MTTTQPLAIALKEWHLVIGALLAGQQAVLLRKGGILEANNEFELEHPRFLLYPTFVHQNPAHIKSRFRDQITPAAAEPATVTLAGWAEVARIFQVPDRARMDRLDDLHLWSPALLDMRFNYRPEKPLYLLVLRAFRLPAPVSIPNTLEYAGCKSWVPLEQSVSLTNSIAALRAEEPAAIVERIRATFG